MIAQGLASFRLAFASYMGYLIDNIHLVKIQQQQRQQQQPWPHFARPYPHLLLALPSPSIVCVCGAGCGTRSGSRLRPVTRRFSFSGGGAVGKC